MNARASKKVAWNKVRVIGRPPKCGPDLVAALQCNGTLYVIPDVRIHAEAWTRLPKCARGLELRVHGGAFYEMRDGEIRFGEDSTMMGGFTAQTRRVVEAALLRAKHRQA